MVLSPASLRNKLKLRQLALLAELESAGTLHKAADRLGMSQPAATRLIHELEELMGASLFERTSRGMSPTGMGHLLIRHASMFLAGIDHVYHEAAAMRDGNAGVLRVGLFPGAPPMLLAHAIAQLKRETPQMDIELADGPNEALLSGLRDAALHLVVGRAPAGRGVEDFDFELLFTESFSVVCAGHGAAVPAGPHDLASLVDRPWILPFPPSALRANLDVLFLSQCGRLPTNLIESVSIPANVALMKTAGCLTVMPQWAARDYAALGQLRILVEDIAHLAGPIGIVTRSGEPRPSHVWRLVQALRAAGQAFAAGDPKTGSPVPQD